MKKFLTKLFVPVLAVAALFSIHPNNNMTAVDAADGPSLSSGGDSFILLDKSYGIDESFVYTADVHFNNGQAAGLTFGSQENDHYFVINMDRYENHVKLMHPGDSSLQRINYYL